MINTAKKRIYRLFVSHFGHHWREPLFQHAAWLLEKLLGLARFDYFGVTVLAGPVGYLDRMIISQQKINSLVMQACSQHLKDGGVFLDIGANHGVLSLLAAKNPRVQVFAFEPSSRELNRLWQNLQWNAFNNISVFSYGLSDKEIDQALAIYPSQNPGMNSLPAIQKTGKKEVCHFAPLVNLLSPHLLQKTRVCKIDVEGQELFILKALQPIMHQLTHCLFIVEVTPDFLEKINLTPADIYQFFSAAGFQAQFGASSSLYQWDEVFFHPERTPLLLEETQA